MARPNKQGLDYFPFDVDFFDDKKIKLIKSEFGIKGEYIAIRLLCLIYGDEGYYYQWGGDECLLLSDDAGADFRPNLINEIVLGLVRRGFFDKSVFDSFKVLTSKGIQKRFLEATKRRLKIDVDQKYWLLDDYTLKQDVDINPVNDDINRVNVNINSKSSLFDNGENTQKIVNDDINRVNVDINRVNVDINSQRKEKESKEKKIRDLYRSKFNQFWNAYNKKVGKELTFKKWNQLTLDEINEILLFVPNYVQATPDQQYRKNPLTFLRQRAWEDEIIERSNHGKNNGTGSKFIDELNEEERQYILRNCSTGQKSN